MRQQPEESAGDILILIIDESYDREEDYVDASLFDDEGQLVRAASAAYRSELQREFGFVFEEANVGSGADVPAFATYLSENLIPLIPWLMAVFFSARPVVDNLEAWRIIFAYIKRFRTRPVLLGRHGAAVVAVEAVFQEMGGTPKAIQLKGYRTVHRLGEEGAAIDDRIEAAPSTITLSEVKHIFEIEADGVPFLVVVDGADARANRI